MRLYKDWDNELISVEDGVFRGGRRYWYSTFYYMDKVNDSIMMVRLDDEARVYHL